MSVIFFPSTNAILFEGNFAMFLKVMKLDIHLVIVYTESQWKGVKLGLLFVCYFGALLNLLI